MLQEEIESLFLEFLKENGEYYESDEEDEYGWDVDHIYVQIFIAVVYSYLRRKYSFSLPTVDYWYILDPVYKRIQNRFSQKRVHRPWFNEKELTQFLMNFIEESGVELKLIDLSNSTAESSFVMFYPSPREYEQPSLAPLFPHLFDWEYDSPINNQLGILEFQSERNDSTGKLKSKSQLSLYLESLIHHGNSSPRDFYSLTPNELRRLITSLILYNPPKSPGAKNAPSKRMGKAQAKEQVEQWLQSLPDGMIFYSNARDYDLPYKDTPEYCLEGSNYFRNFQSLEIVGIGSSLLISISHRLWDKIQMD